MGPEEKLAPEIWVEAEKLIVRESEPGMAIIVQDTPEKLHPFIQNTIKRIKKKNFDNNYLYQRSYSDYVNEDPIFFITSQKGFHERAVAILNTLCHAFIKRGFIISTKDYYYSSSKYLLGCVEILEKKVVFEIMSSSGSLRLTILDRPYCMKNQR